MSYDAFLRELAKAGLSIRKFAELIEMNPNSVSNYARLGEVPDKLAIIAALVAEMSAQSLEYRAVISRLELSAKKPRGGARAGHFGGDRQVPLDLGQ